MTDLSLLSTIGMITLLIGTLPNMRAVLKNRYSLDGYSMIGSIAIMIGQFIFAVYFALVGDWLATFISIPMCIFWVIVVAIKISDNDDLNAWRVRRATKKHQKWLQK